MTGTQDLISVAQAAEELGLTPGAVRAAIKRGFITPVPLDRRTNLVARSEIETYRRAHLGQWGRGKRKKKPATEPAE
jgi:hypothetical protein